MLACYFIACGFSWQLGSRSLADELPWARAVDVPAFQAALVGAGAEGQLQFQDNQATQSIATADLIAWGQFVEPLTASQVVLASGGLIVAESVTIEADQLAGTSPLFANWTLPVDQAAGIVYRSRQQRGVVRQRFERAVAAGGRDDRLLLENGDEIRGTLTALTPAHAALRTEAGPLEIKLATISAIVFAPSLTQLPPADGLRVLVGLQDGSRVTATHISTADAGTQLTLAAGATLTAPTNRIVALQPLGGRVVYLSDLKPLGYRHIPYLELSWPFHNDRSTTGTPLRARGRLYLKGLGMHSPARITYALPEAFQRFEAEVAIDDAAGLRGSVLFRVFVDDGSGVWQQRASSEIVRGGEPPQTISADLTGAQRLSLLVDFADRGDELDHADWLDARLIRPRD